MSIISDVKRTPDGVTVGINAPSEEAGKKILSELINRYGAEADSPNGVKLSATEEDMIKILSEISGKPGDVNVKRFFTVEEDEGESFSDCLIVDSLNDDNKNNDKFPEGFADTLTNILGQKLDNLGDMDISLCPSAYKAIRSGDLSYKGRMLKPLPVLLLNTKKCLSKVREANNERSYCDEVSLCFLEEFNKRLPEYLPFRFSPSTHEKHPDEFSLPDYYNTYFIDMTRFILTLCVLTAYGKTITLSPEKTGDKFKMEFTEFISLFLSFLPAGFIVGLKSLVKSPSDVIELCWDNSFISVIRGYFLYLVSRLSLNYTVDEIHEMSDEVFFLNYANFLLTCLSGCIDMCNVINYETREEELNEVIEKTKDYEDIQRENALLKEKISAYKRAFNSCGLSLDEDKQQESAENNKALLSSIAELERENKKLSEKLSASVADNKALHDEFSKIMPEDTGTVPELTADVSDIDYDAKYGFAIFTRQKLEAEDEIKKTFPNSVIIHDIKEVNKSLDLVVLLTGFMPHSFYISVKKTAKEIGVPIMHCANINIDKICEKIWSYYNS